ncbi:zinc-binding dehydrogenase [Paracoccus seriniphilus]|uniref:Alcohol dehydrogenase, propanol-preferring n=1 Tax=Paracoccus seriniphilus TaxID=184748 RepID=A0A239Q2Z9_9RHOB|nr:alcohol dehydrogenase catalytic domain-containing protein [Paracoccus seriniphilus]SNT76646.1 alcohol dehydrogenase, propanol-preferring [Paracoccus seriniphilus]
MVPQGTEVIINVTAAGVCHTDLHIREGGFDLGHGRRMNYAERGVALPKIAGHEVAGVVAAVGPDAGPVDMSKAYVVYPWGGCGTCDFCAAGEEQLCTQPQFLGIHRDGGYATQVRVAHPRYLFDAGDLAPEIAAPLGCSGLTTYAALKKISSTSGTHTPVLIGGGGLGLMCLQLLKAQKLKMPVVVDLARDKREAALAAGAVAAIDPTDADAIEQVHRACGGAPLAVIDFVGAEQTAEFAMNVVGKGATIIVVGLFGGATPWAIPMLPLKSVTVRGSYTGSLSEFGELMEFARNGAITPIPTKSYLLTQADEVLDLLETGKVIGRAILANG